MSVNELMAINCLSGINTDCVYFAQLKVRKRKQTPKKLKDTIYLFIRHIIFQQSSLSSAQTKMSKTFCDKMVMNKEFKKFSLQSILMLFSHIIFFCALYNSFA